MSRKRKEPYDCILVREATWPHHGYYHTSHVESQTTSTKNKANKGPMVTNGQQRASGEKWRTKGLTTSGIAQYHNNNKP